MVERLARRVEDGLRVQAEPDQHYDQDAEGQHLAGVQIGDAPVIDIWAVESALHYPEGVDGGDDDPNGPKDGCRYVHLVGADEHQELGHEVAQSGQP